MRTFEILNSLQDVTKVITVNTIEDVNDVIYDLKEYHGFNMVYTYNEITE